MVGTHPSTARGDKVNLDELDPDSPEYDAALEAAQAEEDAAVGNLEAEPGDEPSEEPTDEDPDNPADPEAQPTEATAVVDAEKTDPAEVQPKVAGILSKDGSRVMPYSALQAERRAARHERAERERISAELEAARKQIEDLKAGRTPAAPQPDDPDALSDYELADLTDAIPAVGKLAKQLQATKAELAKLKPAAAAQPDEPTEPEDDPVQEAIDAIPLLSEWQLGDAEKFERAKAHDAVLQSSPKWASKTLAERFAEAARRTADEFDIQVDDTPPPPSPKTPNRADPKTVISSAKRATPNTLSDMKGGAVDTDLGRIESLPPARAVARMAEMSDEEIDRHLAKFG